MFTDKKPVKQTTSKLAPKQSIPTQTTSKLAPKQTTPKSADDNSNLSANVVESWARLEPEVRWLADAVKRRDKLSRDALWILNDGIERLDALKRLIPCK